MTVVNAFLTERRTFPIHGSAARSWLFPRDKEAEPVFSVQLVSCRVKKNFKPEFSLQTGS